MILSQKISSTSAIDTRKPHSDALIPSRRPTLSIRCSAFTVSPRVEETLERIRQRFGKVEVSPSSYDTAWVAMVPSKESPNKPCFPQCLDWILENQHKDGSWGLHPAPPSLLKDSLSCTLASLLALQKWNVGEQLVQKGLNFIRANAGAVRDGDRFSPIGFDIIFPSMIKQARELNLVVPLDPVVVDHMLHNRDSKINKRRGNLAYVAEGLGESCDWDKLLNQQRRNGSLFSSPATTAAALIHSHNDKGFDHLLSILNYNKKSWVPTISSADIYLHLCMVDTLERLGISRHFKFEIARVLDETYRNWQQKNEEIFTDVTCCALAFRLLRINGYEVDSDELASYIEQERFFDSASMQFTGVPTILELFRASELTMHEDESILEKINSWTSTFLNQQLQNNTIVDKKLRKEVEYGLKTFNATLARVQHRQTIEQYDENNCQILKTAYRCSNIDNEDFAILSRQDFNTVQAQHREELQRLDRWYEDSSRLAATNKGRNVMHTSFFLGSSVMFEPEASDARVAYTQVITLVARIDDMFDSYGSREELISLIELVKRWEEEPTTGYYSEEVETVYKALYNHINEWAEKASMKQGRCIKRFLVSQWLEFITACMKEVELYEKMMTLTLEEYLDIAWMSIGCQVTLLTPMHLLGPKFSQEIVTSEECLSLCKLISLGGRLLNDVRTFEKERGERALNSVALLMAQSGGTMTQEEAIEKVQEIAEEYKRKLLKIVVQKRSPIPRECKQLFWLSTQNCYYSYCQRDEFSFPRQLIDDMNAITFKPVALPPHIA